MATEIKAIEKERAHVQKQLDSEVNPKVKKSLQARSADLRDEKKRLDEEKKDFSNLFFASLVPKEKLEQFGEPSFDEKEQKMNFHKNNIYKNDLFYLCNVF